MTLHAIVLAAMINSVIGVLCKDGECDLAAVSCDDQPTLCEMTERGAIVMNLSSATAMCSSIGMQRVAPGDDQVNMLAASLCPSAAFFDIVAVRDVPCNRFTVGSTRENATFLPWRSGEPNNANGSSVDGCSGGDLKEGCVGLALISSTPLEWFDRACGAYDVNFVNAQPWTAVFCVVCAKLTIATTTTSSTAPSSTRTTATPMSTTKPPSTMLTTPRTTTKTTTRTTATTIATTTAMSTTNATSPIVLTLPPVDLDQQHASVTTAGNLTTVASTAFDVADSVSTTDTLLVIIAVACMAVLVFLLCSVVVVVIVRRRCRRAAEADSNLPVVLVHTSACLDESKVSDLAIAVRADPTVYASAEFVKASTDKYLPIPRTSEVHDIREQSIHYTGKPEENARGIV
jgi:hypothetical protein